VNGDSQTGTGADTGVSAQIQVATGDVGPGTAAGKDLEPKTTSGYGLISAGPRDLARLPGPFTPSQLTRIDEALTLGSRETGLLFSLYVGPLTEPSRGAAEALAARLEFTPGSGAVFVAVSPGQRLLQIVTTGSAPIRLPNRVCALAALGMRAAFVGGDLSAGIINGLRMLADAAGQDQPTR
jgi:hypothetical protein